MIAVWACAKFAIRYLNRDTKNAFNYVITRSAARTLRGFHADNIVFYRSTGRKKSSQLFQTTIAVWLNSDKTLQNEAVYKEDKIRIDFMGPDASAVWEVDLLKKPSRSSGFAMTTTASGVEFDFDFIEPGDVALVNIIHDKANIFPEVRGRFMSSSPPKQVLLSNITTIADVIQSLVNFLRFSSYWAVVATLCAATFLIAELRLGGVVVHTILSSEGNQDVTGSFVASVLLSLPIMFVVSKVFRRFFGDTVLENVNASDLMQMPCYSWAIKPVLSSRFSLQKEEIHNLLSVLPPRHAFGENRTVVDP